jgi:hypothetical protein
MNDTRQRRYIAHLTERATVGDGMGIFTTWGEVTPCGEWVEQDFIFADKTRNHVVRHKIDKHWCETPEQAMAAKADKIRAIAQKMLEQADQLEDAVRPALATVAATSGDMGRPAEGGE